MYIGLNGLLLLASISTWALTYDCNAQIVDSCNGAIVEKRIDKVSINKHLSKREIHTSIRDGCCTIDIFEQGKPDTLQRISEEFDGNFPPDGIQFADANFDGFRDLLLFYNSGGSNDQFAFWLFNPRSGRFEYNDEFTNSVGVNPSINENNHSIETGGNGGCVGMCFEYDTYTVHENKLLLVERISQELAAESTDKSPPIFVRTLERLQSGKMKVIARIKGTLEEIDEKTKFW